MFQRLLGRDRRANQAIVEGLYSSIVAAARQPKLYSDWDVPDTPLGRFELISLHMFLALRRLRGEQSPADEIAQELTDAYFLEVDHSLRELGIGDTGVPKRMKKLAKMYFGRVQTYGEAIESGNQTALADALKRNIKPDAADWPEAPLLAGYAARAAEMLQAQPAQQILQGAIEFPKA